MAVRKIKNSWWIDIRADYIRYRKRSPENTKAGAEAYEALLRQKLARGEQIDRPAQPPQEQLFKDFAWQWFETYVKTNNKFYEQRSKKNILHSSLIPHFGNMPIQDIDTFAVEKYKAEQIKLGLSPKTIKNRLTILSKCLNTAYDWLKLEGRPPAMKWPKCPPPETDYLSPEECELVLSNATGTMYEMIFVALRTGMRQGELKGLQWSAIDWHSRTLTVRHSLCDETGILGSPKSNKARYIPLDTEIYTLLFNRKKSTGFVFKDSEGKPFSEKVLNRNLSKISKDAGLRKINWHAFRHTFATQLATRGVPLNAIQALLGHSSITTTMRYSHLAPSTLRTAIDMLGPGNLLNADFGQPVGNAWVEKQQKEMLEKHVVSKNL